MLAARRALECVIMKNVAVLFALLLAVLPTAAQVSVEIVLDQEQYLTDEALIAHVKIRNDSGQTVRLGEQPDWLSFIIEPAEGPYVRPLKLPEVQGGFDLQSSYTATKHVNLGPLFELNKTGRYKVTATVRVPIFQETYTSQKKPFLIGKGTPVLDPIKFGVPPSISPLGPDGKPEIRQYILVLTQSGPESKLFVRVTDPMDRNFKVVPIGPVVSFSKYEPQLDQWNNLHILYQIGAKAFLYTIINPEGMVLARERHDYIETRPTLFSNDEGRIGVRGGVRRYTTEDIPPADPAQVLAAQSEPDLPPPTLPSKAEAAARKKDAKEKKKP